jgi:predicted nucleic acid-binding protein
MSDRVFVDSNVLIYSLDTHDAPSEGVRGTIRSLINEV